MNTGDDERVAGDDLDAVPATLVSFSGLVHNLRP